MSEPNPQSIEERLVLAARSSEASQIATGQRYGSLP